MLRFTEYIHEAEEKNPHIKEIKELTASVGGGNKSAGVFESWVHIVIYSSWLQNKTYSCRS